MACLFLSSLSVSKTSNQTCRAVNCSNKSKVHLSAKRTFSSLWTRVTVQETEQWNPKPSWKMKPTSSSHYIKKPQNWTSSSLPIVLHYTDDLPAPSYWYYNTSVFKAYSANKLKKCIFINKWLIVEPTYRLQHILSAFFFTHKWNKFGVFWKHHNFVKNYEISRQFKSIKCPNYETCLKQITRIPNMYASLVLRS